VLEEKLVLSEIIDIVVIFEVKNFSFGAQLCKKIIILLNLNDNRIVRKSSKTID